MAIQKIALIPAYEPDGNLLYIVEALSTMDYTILVVDDGSGNFYHALFEKVRKFATVLHYNTNHGKGYALKFGLSYIRKNYDPASVIVTLDADGQHAPSDVEKVAAKAIKHPLALVLGCRSFDGEVPLRSRIGNILTRKIFALSTKSAIRDTQTGLRAFPYAMIDRMLAIPGERYEYEMNVLIDFARTKTPMDEITIETIYQNNNSSSHFHPARDSFLIYRELMKFTAASFLSFLIDYGLFGLFSLALSSIGSGSLIAANILARLFSATLNYQLNRRFVFDDKTAAGTSAVKYICLAAAVLFTNTLLLFCLCDVFGINRFTAKIVVETALFIASFFVQKVFVFAGSHTSFSHRRLRKGVLTHA